ncbi:hypothetical protein D3C84_697540 [compost metagenome]
MAYLSAMPEAELAELLKNKPVQQLVTASLISRLGWSFGEQPANESKLIKSLQNSTRGSLDNADRLAAVNYQQGDYASAKAFLEQAGDGGLAWWLRAKLALRDGDKTAAAAAYAKAAQAFPQNESWGDRRTPDFDYETLQPKCRVNGESAILALQRGDYLQAFDQLYRSQSIYWFDAATVAERVLTLEELKHYVDTQVPAPPPLTQQQRDNYVPLPVAASLRNLLGRRLLREGPISITTGCATRPGCMANNVWRPMPLGGRPVALLPCLMPPGRHVSGAWISSVMKWLRTTPRSVVTTALKARS